MRVVQILMIICVFVSSANSQTKMDRTIKKLNKESVPYVQVEELSDMNDVILLDTRKKEEYEVSHLENAIWVGHKAFEIDSALTIVHDQGSAIVVYCSIGVRSEDIGEKLQKAGFTNVKNLYGGIFEWKNKGFSVYDSIGNETERVHAFNIHWGKLLTAGEKVYDVEKKKAVNSEQ